MVKEELTRREELAAFDLHVKHIDVSETHYASGVWGVSWPGKGTKTVAETKRFIGQLNKAIKLANKINKRIWTKKYGR